MTNLVFNHTPRIPTSSHFVFSRILLCASFLFLALSCKYFDFNYGLQHQGSDFLRVHNTFFFSIDCFPIPFSSNLGGS